MNAESYIKIAKIVGLESTCKRANVGALIVVDDRIVASGYSGSPSKTDECLDSGCVIVDGHCVRTTHAEINALLQCSKNGISTKGATLYCTHMPCLDCTKAIINAGISLIIYNTPYASGLVKDQLRKEMLHQSGVQAIRKVLSHED